MTEKTSLTLSRVAHGIPLGLLHDYLQLGSVVKIMFVLRAGVETLVRLVAKEGILDTSIKARAYYDAFQVTCLFMPDVFAYPQAAYAPQFSYKGV